MALGRYCITSFNLKCAPNCDLDSTPLPPPVGDPGHCSGALLILQYEALRRVDLHYAGTGALHVLSPEEATPYAASALRRVPPETQLEQGFPTGPPAKY